MRLRLWLLLPALFALVMIAACGDDDPTPTQQVQIDKIQLALDWYPNANHAGLYVARDKGYFTEENLEVEWFTPVDPTIVNQTVAAGQVDFGINYQPDLLLARAQGVPVVSIVGLVQHPLNSVQALQASGISRPRDLAGKKVGYPGIPLNEALLDTMLKSDGVAGGLEEVELLDVGFDLAAVLINETVDACIGCYFSHESFLIENQGHQVNIMHVEEWGVPDFYELVFVASEDTLRDRPDLVQRFVRAVVRGYQDAATDPDAALAILLGGAEEADPAIETPGIQVLAPLWKTDQPVGWQTQERWTEFAKWLHDNGLVAEPVDATQAFTNQFVEGAQK